MGLFKAVTQLLSVLVILGCVSCGGSGSGSGRVRGIIIGSVSSPALDALGTVVELGADLNEADVLVVDAKSNPPGTISANEAVHEALSNGQCVLLVDLTEAHNAQDLIPLMHGGHRGEAHAQLMRRGTDAHGRTAMFVYAFPKEAGKDPTEQEWRAFARGAIAFFELRNKEPEATDGFNPPPGLLYIPYNFTLPPKSAYFTSTKNGADSTNGVQWTSLNPIAEFILLLENGQVATGDRQFVVAKTAVEASPLNYEEGTNKLMIVKEGSSFVTCDIGWFQVELDITIEPESGATFVFQQSQPQNANQVTTVNSRISFGISYTPTSGPGTSFSYTSNDSTNLTSWAVNNSGNGPVGAWQYQNRDPWWWNDPGKWDSLDSFGNGVHGFGSYRTPNELAIDQLQGIAKIVWATTDVVRIVENFSVNTGVTYLNTWSPPFGRIDSGSSSIAINSNWCIEMQAVLPVPLASITFSQNPVDAAQTGQITGSVNLTSEALIDTPIYLSSDSTNASVINLVKIKQGQTSAQFQILVNTNNILPGNSTVANIKAFNATEVQAALTIQN